MENGTGLSTHKPVNNKKQVPLIPHSEYIRWGRKEKNVHKARFEVEV